MCTEKDPLRPGTKMTERAWLLAEYLDTLREVPMTDEQIEKTALLRDMRDQRFAHQGEETHLGGEEMAEFIRQKEKELEN